MARRHTKTRLESNKRQSTIFLWYCFTTYLEDLAKEQRNVSIWRHQGTP
jgi:hypothetical protein